MGPWHWSRWSSPMRTVVFWVELEKFSCMFYDNSSKIVSMVKENFSLLSKNIYPEGKSAKIIIEIYVFSWNVSIFSFLWNIFNMNSTPLHFKHSLWFENFSGVKNLKALIYFSEVNLHSISPKKFTWKLFVIEFSNKIQLNFF